MSELLPDGVVEAWFHVSAGGEVYTSRLCRGRDLRRVFGELMFGSPTAEHDDLDKIMAELADPDFWWVNDGRCCTCHVACGEDPDIEVHLVDESDLRAVTGDSMTWEYWRDRARHAEDERDRLSRQIDHAARNY